jgi:CHAT domain-containing protein
MAASLVEQLQEHFETCSAFFRDTTLSLNVLGRYKPGLFLREPTFCDATYKLGGFIAPHRYLIISSSARSLDEIAPQPWGLCIWQRNSVFKILDVIGDDATRQITLLEIPEVFLRFFCAAQLSPLEQVFVEQARQTYLQSREMQLLPELDNDQWRKRLVFPVGVDDQGQYFPLYEIDTLADNADPQTVAAVLNQMGATHLAYGELAEAHRNLSHAMRVPMERPDPGARAVSVLLLGRVEEAVGDPKKAEEYFHEAFRLFQASGEPHRRELAITIEHLAMLYHRAGQLEDAERHYLHALKIKRSISERSAGVALTLSSLGALHEMSQRFDDAERSLRESLEIGRESFRPDDPQFATILSNVARLAQRTGRHDEALRSFEEALSLERDGPDRATLLYNIAEIHIAMKRPDLAFAAMRQALGLDDRTIVNVSSFASERQRIAILQSLRFRLDQFISLVTEFLSDSVEAVTACADLILRRKGLSADALAIRHDALVSGRYPHLQPHIDELFRVRARIAASAMAGSKRDDEDDLALRDKLESELSREIPEMRLDTVFRNVDYRGVVSAIPAGAVLIELVRSDDDYVALLLSAGRDGPRLVRMGEAARVDSLLARFRSAITGQTREEEAVVGLELWHALFDPLQLNIEGRERLFISPDGALARLPWEVLPMPDGRRVIDALHVSYLSTGRDLLRFEAGAPRASGEPLVMASPDFDLSSCPAVASAAGGMFDPLPGTKDEGEEIARLLGVRPLIEQHALESVLKRARSPRIVHLATHGFVLDYEAPLPLQWDDYKVGMTITGDRSILVLDNIMATPVSFVESSSMKNIHPKLSGERMENPLLRSGLALAGANTWLRGGELPPEAEDGILTAEDVTGLDLAGTELVVLSACDTGLGDVHRGEGVFGLRRSFVLAGAHTLVISLWQVPDEQTMELMSSFYLRLLSGEPRSQALRGAQLMVKERRPHPADWGAFICQGDPRPLEWK